MKHLGFHIESFNGFQEKRKLEHLILWEEGL